MRLQEERQRLFCERARTLRKVRRLTQKEVAEKIGIIHTNYTRYENGAREPDIETIVQLAELYDISIDYLIGRTDAPYYECEIPTLEQVIVSTDPRDVDNMKPIETPQDLKWLPKSEPEFRAYVMAVINESKGLLER